MNVALRPPIGDAERWAAIADFYPEGLPALSRYGRFLLALRDARLAAHGHSGVRQGLDPHAAVAVHPPGVPAAAQPDLRRMADGLAAAMDDDSAWSRTERLAMLGNGVVPLQAAYAVRALVARLAARNAPGADGFVRMMGQERAHVGAARPRKTSDQERQS